MNRKECLHLQRALSILSTNQPQSYYSFGTKKRKKKSYTTAHKKTIHYLDKSDVLDRIIILLKEKSLQRNIATLLAIVFITNHQGPLQANALPLSHNDFLFLTNLAYCIEFLNIYNDHETIIKRFHRHRFRDELLIVQEELNTLFNQCNIMWLCDFFSTEDAFMLWECGTTVEASAFKGTNKELPLRTNKAWHWDPRHHMAFVYATCHPEPHGGCGTRVCEDMKISENDYVHYPDFQNFEKTTFSEREYQHLEAKCKVLASEQLTFINFSRHSKVLHRGPNPKELGDSTRIFFSFEECKANETQHLANIMEPYLKKCNSKGLSLENLVKLYDRFDDVTRHIVDYDLLL